ncbi:facilitated trehalose transporter Tret1-like [Photinus pyralis]|uniref:facilitated trehalose transporter Tret1-like n=1 Tax=Photinus pyralis TaxID=7054 RepID=UPI0012670F82|nr:facilitated trehalose transporter Tret1-like [Photinus pyralis]XP_031355730.1 facilitated trehalose transporter Tret1-like [Photinus pyralis]
MKAAFIALEKRSLQYGAVFTGLLVALCCGLHLGWTSPYLPVLLSEDSPIPMTADESSWVGTVYLLGGVCGSVLLSVFGRLIGRKSILLWSSVPFCTSWIIIAFATTLPELLIGRYIAGVCEGLCFASLPIYFSEISDKEIRGMISSTASITLFVGVMVINLVGSYTTIQTSSLVLLSVPLLHLLTFIWMPESPNYLLMKGKIKEARRSFVALKGTEDADRNLDMIARAIEEENVNQTNFTCLLRRNNRRKLVTLFGLRLAQQFSGITAFSIYAQILFKEGDASIPPVLGVMIFYGIQLIFSILSSLLVDKLGRRPLLMASSIGAVVTLLVEGAFFFVRDFIRADTSHVSLLPTVVLFVFIVSYSLGLQTMPNFMASELFPTNLKAYASTVATVLLYAFGAISTELFQFTKDNYGLFVPFWSFAIVCSVGSVIVAIFLPETKNRTLEDIQTELNQQTSGPTSGSDQARQAGAAATIEG